MMRIHTGVNMDKSKLEPTEKQIAYCMTILKRIGSCPCAEDGTPCFEESMQSADDFIKKHKKAPWEDRDNGNCNPEDWGIPNH